MADSKEASTLDSPKSTSENAVPAVVEQPEFAGSRIPIFGLICIAAISSYLFGRYGLSVLWAILALSATHAVISRRMARFYSYHTHAVQREAQRQKLDRHIETTEWINFMLERFWTVIEPTVSIQVTEKVNVILQNHCPAFLDSIELTEFTLGSSPPAILGAKVYPQTEPDTIHLDLEVCFIPNEVEGESNRAAPRAVLAAPPPIARWNSKVVLNTRIGKGMLGVDVPVMLKGVSFYAKLRIQIELAPTAPFLSKLQICFLEAPKIDFILKPLKSFDLMDLPGLSSWLFGLINSTLAAKLVDPNMMTIPIGKGSGYSDVCSIGVLKVTLYQVRGLKITGAVSEPFVKIQTGGKFRACSTRIIPGTTEWNQIFYLLVYNLKNPVSFVVMTSISMTVGSVSYSVSEIETDGDESSSVWRTIVAHDSSKIHGELNFGIEYYPAADVRDPEADLNFESGIAQITLHQIKDMLGSGLDKKHLNCFYEVFVHQNNVKIDPKDPTPPAHDPNYYRSRVKKKTNSPTWEDTFEVFLDRRSNWSVTVFVRHALKEDMVLAVWSAPFNNLINRTDWFHFDNSDKAQFYGSFLFRPVRIDLSELSSGKLSPCLGLVRVRIMSGSGLKSGRGAYSVAVDVNGRSVGKTKSALSETAPIWNKTFTAIIRDHRDKMTLDVQHTEKGFSYGHIGCSMAELVAHQGYDIERNEPLFDENGRELPGRLRFTIGLYVVHRDADLAGIDSETLDVFPLRDRAVKSNCGILEIHSVTVKGVEPTTIKSLHLVELSWNNDSPVYRTQPAKMSVGGTQQWTRFSEVMVVDADEIDLTFTIKETQGTIDEFVDTVSIPFTTAVSNQWYTLDGITRGQLKFAATFHALPLVLDPEVEESGTLSVEIIEAKDLIAVDTGGTSDPFCVVRLNGNKVYKSKVVKKCVSPHFNETFEVEIKQRDGSVLEVEVRDWNKITMSRSLGVGRADLQNLPCGQWHDLEIPLENVSSGKIRFRLKFTPTQTGKGPRRPAVNPNVIAVPLEGTDAVAAAAATGEEEEETERLDRVGEGEGDEGKDRQGPGGPRQSGDLQEKEPKDNAPGAESDAIETTGSVPVEQSMPSAQSAERVPTVSKASESPKEKTASGLRVTIGTLSVDGGGASFECKIKVRRENTTIYKTQQIKGSATHEWNESFTLDREVALKCKMLEFVPVWTRPGPAAKCTLVVGDLDLGGEAGGGSVSLPLQGSGVSGRLTVQYAVVADGSNAIDTSRRRGFSFLGMGR